MRHLSLAEILLLHQRIVEQSGGAHSVRDLAALESAVAQPRMTFDQTELYPTLTEKAAALGYSLILNHPFVDGNKRLGHAAMETLLVLNGFEIGASADEAERAILGVAAGAFSRIELVAWLGRSIRPIAETE